MRDKHMAIARPQKTFSYLEVAFIYMKAITAGEPVQAAVAEHFQISTNAAGKRIYEARRRGLLPKASA